MGVDHEETSIVTSSGSFVIAWDFKKVQKGILDSYEIKQYVFPTLNNSGSRLTGSASGMTMLSFKTSSVMPMTRIL